MAARALKLDLSSHGGPRQLPAGQDSGGRSADLWEAKAPRESMPAHGGQRDARDCNAGRHGRKCEGHDQSYRG